MNFCTQLVEVHGMLRLRCWVGSLTTDLRLIFGVWVSYCMQCVLGTCHLTIQIRKNSTSQLSRADMIFLTMPVTNYSLCWAYFCRRIHKKELQLTRFVAIHFVSSVLWNWPLVLLWDFQTFHMNRILKLRSLSKSMRINTIVNSKNRSIRKSWSTQSSSTSTINFRRLIILSYKETSNSKTKPSQTIT